MRLYFRLISGRSFECSRASDLLAFQSPAFRAAETRFVQLDYQMGMMLRNRERCQSTTTISNLSLCNLKAVVFQRISQTDPKLVRNQSVDESWSPTPGRWIQLLRLQYNRHLSFQLALGRPESFATSGPQLVEWAVLPVRRD
jgi:hypothetical protein